MEQIKKIFILLKQKINKMLTGGRSLFYIGVYDYLPATLKADEEKKLIEELDGKSRNEAVNELVRRNLRLVVYIAKKFDSHPTPLEDIVSIGTIGLIKAVNTFDSEKKIKLATYASKCIENEILMHIRKTVRQKNEVSFDEPLTTDKEGNELLLSDVVACTNDAIDEGIEKESEYKILHDSIEKLSKKEQGILGARYGIRGNVKKTQKEIADEMEISQSYISRMEKKIIETLKKEVLKMYQ